MKGVKGKTIFIVLMALMLVIPASSLMADNVKWSWSTEYGDVDSFRYSFDNENWKVIDGSLRSIILRNVAPGTTMYLQQSPDGLIWSETAWATWNGEEVEGEILFQLPDAPEMVIRQYTRVSEISDAVNSAKALLDERGDDFARAVVSEGVVRHSAGDPVRDLDGNTLSVGEDGALLYADGTSVTDLEGNQLYVLDNGRLVRADGTLPSISDVISEDMDEERIVPLSKMLRAGAELDDMEPLIMAAGVKDGVFVDVNGKPVLDVRGEEIPAYVFPNGRVADQYGNPVTGKTGTPLYVDEDGTLVDETGADTALYPVYDEKGSATVSVWEDGRNPAEAGMENGKDATAAEKSGPEPVGVYVGAFVSYQDPAAANWMGSGVKADLAYGLDLRLTVFDWFEAAGQLSFFQVDGQSNIGALSSTLYIGPRIPIRTDVGELSVSIGFGFGHTWMLDKGGSSYMVNGGSYDDMWANSHLLYTLGFGWDFDQFGVPLAFQIFWATGARDSYGEMGQHFDALSLCPDFSQSSVGFALDLKF